MLALWAYGMDGDCPSFMTLSPLFSSLVFVIVGD